MFNSFTSKSNIPNNCVVTSQERMKTEIWITFSKNYFHYTFFALYYFQIAQAQKLNIYVRNPKTTICDKSFTRTISL